LPQIVLVTKSAAARFSPVPTGVTHHFRDEAMSEAPKLTEEQIARAAYDFAATMMRRGQSALKVQEELVKKMLPQLPTNWPTP